MIVAALWLAACDGGTPQPSPLPPTAVPSPTLTATPAPTATPTQTLTPTNTPAPTPTFTPTPKPLNPLAIERMRQQAYPGSALVIEQTLAPGANYERYIASYKSEGLKIYALLTVPRGDKPQSGWPVIVFNHGFIPPAEYRTTERYVAYVDTFARNGYIVFKSDYRGHGSSEGRATGGYGTPDYTVDVLNAVSSIKQFKDADASRIGMWGHSMGGQVTLRAMVTTRDVRAGVIWAGVVDSYADLLANWGRGGTGGAPNPAPVRGWRSSLVEEYGSPEQNPQFWDSISPNAYLKDLSGPVQLHHGTADTSVPIRMSENLARQIKAAGKSVEYFVYPGDDHNISASFVLAMQRSVAFFNQYVKP
ncbi:MAG: alpha/beta fold hydrolase [Chloroflexi bacterium]|nr:alpha/beta fold hydrolase [Chloroflexota bacterium]